jgi:hypothetical protein
MDTTDWTTRVLPEFTRQYGVEEIHSVWLLPKDWPGKGAAVTLGIPECELQCCFIGEDGEPVVFINRPQINRSVKSWTRTACEMARDHKAAVHFSCDTPEQAAQAAKRAAKLLPSYERLPLERMYDANTRSRSDLN